MMELFLRGQSFGITTDHAPDDLSVVGVDQPNNAIGDYFYLIVQSKTFKAIRSNEAIPEVEFIEFYNI